MKRKSFGIQRWWSTQWKWLDNILFNSFCICKYIPTHTYTLEKKKKHSKTNNNDNNQKEERKIHMAGYY